MKDPVQYAQDKLVNMIDHVSVMTEEVNTINNNIKYLKELIREFFSDNLQIDESPMGAMKRNQIRKELLEFAHK
jgi:hypothetical protein